MKGRNIQNYKEFIHESFTEFNVMRLNQDRVRPAIQVDDPQLSINAFDKHQDSIRMANARLSDILHNLGSSNSISNLKNAALLNHQNVKNLKVIRILKATNNVNYDVYISFTIEDIEYWGVIYNINTNPEFKSEVFKDQSIIQTKEWCIRTKGVIIKAIKEWLKPIPGSYRLLNDGIICYSTETGKQLRMYKDIVVDVVRSFNDKIVVKYKSDTYNLVNDNRMYFNWWFEKID